MLETSKNIRDLEELVKNKVVVEPHFSWKINIEENPQFILSELIKKGKIVNAPSVKAFLTANSLHIEPTESIRENKIPLNGDNISSAKLFPILYDSYQSRVQRIGKNLVSRVLGKEHYRLFQYTNKGHIETGEERERGPEGVGPYYFIHPYRAALYLKTNNAPGIAIDLELIHDLIEAKKKKREEMLKRGEGNKTDLKKSIENPPEYNEIKRLYKNEKEYGETLVEFLRSITLKSEERGKKEESYEVRIGKYRNYIQRLVDSCERFYNEDGLIKKEYLTPIIAKYADRIDNTNHIRELRYYKQIETLDKNYELLRKSTELIEKLNVDDKLSLKLRKDLLITSIQKSQLFIWTYKIDKEISQSDYDQPIQEFQRRHYMFVNMYKQLFPKEKIPLLE